MKRTLITAFFIGIATISVAATKQPLGSPSAMPWRIFVPPEHVSHWIGIIWAGAMNHPIMPVFYTTEHRTPPEASLTRYVYLTPQEYQILLNSIKSVTCSRERIFSKPPYPNTILIQEYSQHKVRDLCVFPRDGGCEYLFGMAKLPGIDWPHKDTYPLFQFEAEFGCKEPLTKWHEGRPN